MTDETPTGEWITHPVWASDSPPREQPVLRAVWQLDAAPRRAELRVAAVGVWEAHIGGRRVGDAWLEPGSSDVRTRFAVRPIDVTALLRPGANEFVMQLGEGPSYVRAAPGRYTKFTGRPLAPRARVELEITDELGAVRTLASDGTWTSRLGPTVLSNWYGGEDYDVRRETPSGLGADDAWRPVAVVGASHEGPPAWDPGAASVRLQEVLTPVATTRIGSAFVADFGRNFAGVVEISADRLGAGETLVMRPAEYLDAEGRVDQFSTGSPIFDRVTGAGSPVRWNPRFVYHGLRYVQVELISPQGARLQADPTAIRLRGLRLMSDNRPTGRLELSDAALAGVDRLITNAAQSNLFTVPTDCPHREKLGWLEQLHLVFAPLAFRWDIRAQWTDMITHIADAQTPSGLIPSIAPELVVFDFDFEPGFRDDVNWGGAIWHIPHLLHRHYGDAEAGERAWEAGLRYLTYLDEQAGDGLLTTGLGDWIALDDTTPRPLVAAHGHASVLDSAASVARTLGRDSHARLMTARAREVRALLRAEYRTQAFAGSQASAALMADGGGLTPDERRRATAHLVRLLTEADGQQTFGEIGLPAALRVLARAERHDVIHRFVTHAHGPGYGQMLQDGMTALSEHWTGTRTRRSANHFMLGAVGGWFIESLVGMRQEENSIAWRSAVISPRPLATLERARSSFDSPTGTYDVAWAVHEHVLRLDVTVPRTGSARLLPPPGWIGTAATVGPGAHTTEYRKDEG